LLKELSPLQRLLLVNTSERIKREAGALERENGSVSTQRDCWRELKEDDAKTKCSGIINLFFGVLVDNTH